MAHSPTGIPKEKLYLVTETPKAYLLAREDVTLKNIWIPKSCVKLDTIELNWDDARQLDEVVFVCNCWILEKNSIPYWEED